MPQYIIYFNQQWVGGHSEEWFESRGPLARQVVSEMRDAGVLLFAGGLEEEIESALGFDETGASIGPVSSEKSFIGGLTIVEAASDEEAAEWGAKVAVACGWPQEVRKFKGTFE